MERFVQHMYDTEGTAENVRTIMWWWGWGGKNYHLFKWMKPQESLVPSHMENWVTWKSLNRWQSGAGRIKVKLSKPEFLPWQSPLRMWRATGNFSSMSMCSVSHGRFDVSCLRHFWFFPLLGKSYLICRFQFFFTLTKDIFSHVFWFCQLQFINYYLESM